MTGSEKGRGEELYDQHRQHLTQSLVDQSSKYDRAVFVLSSGAIALSTTYFDKLVGHGKPVLLASMWAAWSFFVLCLSCSVFSYWTSAKAIQADIVQLDDAYESGSSKWRRTGWNRATESLNLASLVFFVLGASFFLIFAFNNLGRLP